MSLLRRYLYDGSWTTIYSLFGSMTMILQTKSLTVQAVLYFVSVLYLCFVFMCFSIWQGKTKNDAVVRETTRKCTVACVLQVIHCHCQRFLKNWIKLHFCLCWNCIKLTTSCRKNTNSHNHKTDKFQVKVLA